ncbi:DHA1 family bicyclomycin/chloramphenicol resistance-like MFS transporter [Kitasatospora sp. MAP12-15]|uniref:multidrug effflux MFS transporter n=1 Tax=unclassified Kitasatospora TaxID=2633591 RepID=UPI00247705BD|nr:multidrug effflux MFS transporter [Kitasatospora sp. MAP12-44]MDH6110656.1 DHA1 family bicyclomycin/chloramphenicol resistance-like MFS transporter [Kitasatospora sp. MAP12-44]
MTESTAAVPVAIPSLPTGAQRVGLLLTLVLGALSALAPLSMDMYLPSLPRITVGLHTSDALVQLTLTACLVGLALGQLVAGPLSDTLGRRRPLLTGLALYVLSTAVCAFASDVRLLIACRVVQGLSGAAGIVISRAVVRDLFDGLKAARFASTLMLVSGAAPLLAPVLGGQVLRFTSWRGVFVVLAGLGVLILLASAVLVRETLPPARRRRGGLPDTARTIRALLADRLFSGYVLTVAFGFGALFAFIAASPYVVQNLYHGSAQTYSLLFALVEAALVGMTQVTGRLLLGRFRSHRIQLTGVLLLTLSGGLLLAMATVWHTGLPGITAGLFLMAGSLGVITPPSSALALQRAPHAAGTASALLGTLQFLTGAIAPALVGLGGQDSALPMAAVILGTALLALGAFVLCCRPWQADADPLLPSTSGPADSAA